MLRGTSLARVGIGVAMTFGTRRLLRTMLRDEAPSASFELFARTVGIRDTVFGLGCLLASFGDGREARRWVRLWLANEVADVIVAAAASRRLGARGAVTAAVPPLPFIAADVWVLRNLDAT